MPFPFFQNKKEKIVAILDIGSASVGGALVTLKEGEMPKVLFSTREDMVFQSDLNLERFTASMLSSLERVLNKMENSGEEKPHTFFCVLSSLWYESETKIIKTGKDKTFIVTPEMIDELIKKEIDSFSSTVSINNKINDISEVIDVKNIQVKLNGYETSNPYKKRAKNIEIALFIGLGSVKILKAIEDKIAKSFYIKNIEFSTFSLSSFSTVRDMFSDKNNFLFMDITGEVTSIFLVEDNVLVKSILFPLGKNFIIRRIANEMNTTPQEAKSLMRMMNVDKNSEETKTHLENILLKVKKEWLGSFTQNIATLSKEYSTPNTIFFTADSDIAKWFGSFLGKEEFTQILLADDVFDVVFLDIKLLEKFCSFKSGVLRDPFIVLEAIFANKNQDII